MLDFTKVSVLGNDFIVFVSEAGNLKFDQERLGGLCDRRNGVGGDGVLTAVKIAAADNGGASLSYPDPIWRVSQYDRFGAIEKLSGNGACAVVHCVKEKGLVAHKRRDTIAVINGEQIFDVLVGVGGYGVNLSRWQLLTSSASKSHSDVERRDADGLDISIGKTHRVVQLVNKTELQKIDSGEFSEACRVSGFDAAVFACLEENPVQDGIGQIRARFYTGKNGELPADAEAAAAAALTLRRSFGRGGLLVHNWRVIVPGGRVAVRMFPTQDGEHVSVRTRAETVFTGSVAT
ncbi:hypothetical protein KJY77_02070 [Canibacter sp. lx-72]|uniref:hypothetical protein n=1 Tax=Canibacter zhuwentaonis TaxID=2837491 RepID=UPI001BDD8801|nr:hypothetical protein [Canibacter zhuwentaonis]MBT1017929.1 hypothetical protein [Canibacter zhuwentaonis]